MLTSDPCDYSDACIVLEGDVNIVDPNNDAYHKKLAFKNNIDQHSFSARLKNHLYQLILGR